MLGARFAGGVNHCELPWLRIWPTVLNYALYWSTVRKTLFPWPSFQTDTQTDSQIEHGVQDQTTQDFKQGIWDEKATNVAVVFNIIRISLQYKADVCFLFKKKLFSLFYS